MRGVLIERSEVLVGGVPIERRGMLVGRKAVLAESREVLVRGVLIEISTD